MKINKEIAKKALKNGEAGPVVNLIHMGNSPYINPKKTYKRG